MRDEDTTDLPLVYRSECWPVRKQDKKRIIIITAEISLLRKIAGISRLQKIRNAGIRQHMDRNNSARQSRSKKTSMVST